MVADLEISERELLLQWGFKPYQIIDLPGDKACLDYAILRREILSSSVYED